MITKTQPSALLISLSILFSLFCVLTYPGPFAWFWGFWAAVAFLAGVGLLIRGGE